MRQTRDFDSLYFYSLVLEGPLNGQVGARARCPRTVFALQDTNVNTPFFQVPMLVFGHGAGTRVQGRDLVLVHKSGHRVPLCTLFLQEMGQSTALYSLISSRFKMASDVANWSNYVRSRILDTQVAKTTPFCAGTQALVPGFF